MDKELEISMGEDTKWITIDVLFMLRSKILVKTSNSSQ